MSKKLLAVCTCRTLLYQDAGAGHHNGSNERVQAIIDTWVARWLCRYADQIDLRFFVGRGEQQVRLPYCVELDARDDYYGLPEKVKKICDWAYRAGYEEITKLDDDVFLYVDHLLANPSNADYRGFAIESDIKYASGTCYQLSRRAMKLVADAKIPQGEWREDRHVGNVLLANGIQLVDEPRFHCCHCDNCQKLIPENVRISSHTSSPSQMYKLYEQTTLRSVE